MKFVPKTGQLIGRLVITKPRSSIVLADPTKETSKFLLIDAAAEDTGYKEGDMVMPSEIGKIHLFGGIYQRPLLDKSKVVVGVEDWNPDDLLIQNEGAGKFVEFGASDAARPLNECLKSIVRLPPSEEAGASDASDTQAEQPADKAVA